MLIRHRTDTTITPDPYFEAKDDIGFEEFSEFIKEIPTIMKNQTIFKGKSRYFHESLVKHFC